MQCNAIQFDSIQFNSIQFIQMECSAMQRGARVNKLKIAMTRFAARKSLLLLYLLPLLLKLHLLSELEAKIPMCFLLWDYQRNPTTTTTAFATRHNDIRQNLPSIFRSSLFPLLQSLLGDNFSVDIASKVTLQMFVLYLLRPKSSQAGALRGM